MKRILCYGDSNTWGYIPGTCQRYPADVRWTGIMAEALGKDFQVIEAGLNGRTTVYDDPFSPILNGLSFLPMTLVQSMPLDLIIISLGTNDLKFQTAANSARGIGKLVETCLRAPAALPTSSPIFNGEVKVLVISPIEISSKALENNPLTSLRQDCVEESKKYPDLVKRITDGYHVEYLNAAEFASPSTVDGVHMFPEDHAALAAAITEKVRQMLA